MKILLNFLLYAGLVLGIALGTAVWADPASQEPADAYAFFNEALSGPPCGSQVLGVSITGNTTRLTMLAHSLIVSEDPRLTGQLTNAAEVTINEVSGHLGVHGFFILEPFGYAGTWESNFNISLWHGKSIDLNGLMIVKDSQITARGTGEFEGQWWFLEHGQATSPPPYDIPVEDPDGPGGCEFLGEVFTGRILDPRP